MRWLMRAADRRLVRPRRRRVLPAGELAAGRHVRPGLGRWGGLVVHREMLGRLRTRGAGIGRRVRGFGHPPNPKRSGSGEGA